MKKLTEYKTFYLITKILGLSLIVLTLMGCARTIEIEGETNDSSFVPSIDTNIFIEDTIVENNPKTLSENNEPTYYEEKENFSEIKVKIDELDSFKLEKEKWHKLKMQKEKIYNLEMRVDSSNLKWDSIEDAAREYRKEY